MDLRVYEYEGIKHETNKCINDVVVVGGYRPGQRFDDGFIVSVIALHTEYSYLATINEMSLWKKRLQVSKL